jgi:hypothetical protein
MRRTTLLSSTLALLLAGSASFAMAQDTRPPTPAPPAAAPVTHDKMAHMHRHDLRDHGMDGRHMRGFEGGAIGDLRALERLYLESGRSKELPALYNEVLSKTQDPRLRDYAYHHLARAQARPANVDQAIATLRKSLEENLANEARMRTEHAKMRAEWQQRHATMPANAPADH